MVQSPREGSEEGTDTLSSASPWPLSRSSLGPREAGVFISYFICHLLVKGCHLFVVVQSLSRVRLSATPRTAAHQASLSSLEGCKFSLLLFSSSRTLRVACCQKDTSAARHTWS